MPVSATGPLAPIDYAYLGFGTDATLTAEANAYAFLWHNIVKNSPGQIVTDGVEPQWWDDSGSATLTDEDAAGEAIPDKFERVFKLVTTADDHYGYQTETFADEYLLDAGTTVVSLSVWVYCASANVASVGLYGTNLGLEESAQHTGSSAWELLTVEGITLDAADTSIQVRLICDTGTAYFAAPMLNVGARALPWLPRGEKYVARTAVVQLNLPNTGDVAWTTTDCTANTDPLATGVHLYVEFACDAADVQSRINIGHGNVLMGGTDTAYLVRPTNGFSNCEQGFVRCDDDGTIQYNINEIDGDNDLNISVQIVGYWMWD